MPVREQKLVVIVGAVCLAAGIALGKQSEHVPYSTSISTSGQPVTVRELQGRVEILELRVAVRDDAIDALLLRCGALQEGL